MLTSLHRKNVFEKADWLFLVESDTFAIMENLRSAKYTPSARVLFAAYTFHTCFRYFLAGLNKNEAHYLGHALDGWDITYNDAGAGIVLSKGALRKLMGRLAKVSAICSL